MTNYLKSPRSGKEGKGWFHKLAHAGSIEHIYVLYGYYLLLTNLCFYIHCLSNINCCCLTLAFMYLCLLVEFEVVRCKLGLLYMIPYTVPQFLSIILYIISHKSMWSFYTTNYFNLQTGYKLPVTEIQITS